MREYSKLDKIINRLDRLLDIVFIPESVDIRTIPNQINGNDTQLSSAERNKINSLMRVNHVGEICAQSLYYSQAVFARDDAIYKHLICSANEELNHLHWCEQRIINLNGRTSYLKYFWRYGATSFGLLAGLCGDKWSLGFIAETEKQVTKHIENHLTKLPEQDINSQNILKQMHAEEITHAENAQQHGAKDLPIIIKKIMHFYGKCMTNIAYYI